jgi:CBS domain containing-hemolysin-like protein
MTIALGLGAVVLLILANGWFVAGEFAFTAANKTRLDELAKQGNSKAARALAVTRRLSFVLSGAQLGITVTSLIVGFIAEPVFRDALQPLFQLLGMPPAVASGVAVTSGFVLATGAQMVFGELAPKNLAIAVPDRFSMSLARSVWIYTRVAGPVIRLFDSASNRLLRALGIEPIEELESAVSPEELELIVNESEKHGALDEAKADLLSRALAFRSLRAGDAMVPRHEVASLPIDATCGDLRQLALQTGHSRFPVTGEAGLDDVKGVVQVKDVLRVPADSRDFAPLRPLVQPALAVPESALLGPLLADLRGAHRQLAVVVDEYGGTAGIVTLEDIVEELVGSIQDEYDRAEPVVSRLGDSEWRVPGWWRLHEVERDTGVTLPEGDYDTVGGLIMAELGRVPTVGDVVELPEAMLYVEALRGLAVGRARLQAKTDDADGPS